MHILTHAQDMRGKKPFTYSQNAEVRVSLGGPADPADDPDEVAPTHTYTHTHSHTVLVLIQWKILMKYI